MALRTVITGENHDRIVFNAAFFDGVQDLPRSKVHLGEAVGPIAVPGLAHELRIRQCRHVNQRKGNVGEKRLARARILLDECNGPRCDFLFHRPPVIQVQYAYLPGLFTLARLIDGLSWDQVRVPALF